MNGDAAEPKEDDTPVTEDLRRRWPGAITTASARAAPPPLQYCWKTERTRMTSQLSSSLFPSRLHLSLLDEHDASRRSPFAITRLWD